MSKSFLNISSRVSDGNNSISKQVSYSGLEVQEQASISLNILENENFITADNLGWKFLFLEVTEECDIIINDESETTVTPMLVGTQRVGFFVISSNINKLEIVNNTNRTLKASILAHG